MKNNDIENEHKENKEINEKSEKNKKLLRKAGYFLLSLVIIFAAWTLFTWIIQIINNNVPIFPYPWVVIADFFKLMTISVEGGTIQYHAWMSFLRVMIGCGYAFLIGVPLAIVSASNKVMNTIVYPIIDLLRPIPPIAWIPFAIIVFGLTPASYSFIIFIGAFFPIFINTYDGVKRSPKLYKDIALSLGASKSQLVWDVLLPNITPNIFTGIKSSVGVGWMCVIAAELMGISDGGIGYFINAMKNYGVYSYMIAGMIMIAIIGLLLNTVFNQFEKRVLRWL